MIKTYLKGLLILAALMIYDSIRKSLGMVMPLGYGYAYGPDIAMNLEMRAKRMTLKAYSDLEFEDYIDWVSRKSAEGRKEIGPVGKLYDGENVKPASRAAIQMIEDFRPKKGGGKKMQFQVMDILKGNPTFGDKQIEGSGEKVTWAYEDLDVNMIRKAVQMSGGEYDKYNYAEYVDQIAEDYEPKLTDYMRRYNNANFRYAILEGRSLELTEPKSVGGLALDRIVHPNIYMASGGWVGGIDYVTGRRPGSANYESDVAAAFDGLTNSDKLTVALIEKFGQVITAHKDIAPPIENKYGAYWPLFIPSAGVWQLKQDPDFKEIRTQILPSMMAGKDPRENWALNGALGFVGPFALKEASRAFGVHTNMNPYGWDSVTAGKVRFGPQWKSTSKKFTPMLDIDQSELCVAICIGVGMLYGGLGSRIEFNEETFDHKNQSEASCKVTQGLRRKDAIDRDGFYGTKNDFAWHQGSALLAFKAPKLT